MQNLPHQDQIFILLAPPWRSNHKRKVGLEKYIPVVFMFLLSTVGYGQTSLTIGPKVGISSSSLLIDDIDVDGQTRFESLFRSSEYAVLGFHAGGFVKYSLLLGGLDYLHLQGELYYVRAGGNVSYRFDDGSGEQRFIGQETFNRLDLPFLIGYELLSIRVIAGPVFSQILSSDSELDDRPEISRDFKDFSLGFQLGLGVDFNRFLLDFRYERIGNLEEETLIQGQRIDLKSRVTQFTLTLGWPLFKKEFGEE